ncbi:TRAP-type transport system, small permease component [Lachnospiraceae bacterium JC7]|nr:TRAP-type transport system, small permease component [Lachnospiraceae bacterium JC7]
MGFVKSVHKLSEVLDKVMEYIIFVMLLLMVIITGAQIVCRMFFQSLQWSEEATRYLLIWCSMLGAGCVYKHGGHIAVTVLQDVVPAGVKRGMKLLVHALCFVLCVAVVFYGVKYFGKQGTQLSPSLRWPMRFIYLGIDFGCGFMAVHALDAFLQLFFRLTNDTEVES